MTTYSFQGFRRVTESLGEISLFYVVYMTIFRSKEINKLFPLTAYMASRETESGGGQNHATTVFKNLY